MEDRPLPSLFAGFNQAELAELTSRETSRPFAVQQVVFRQGEAARRLFLLRKGRVALTYTSDGGRHIVLRLLGPGDAFGLSCLLPDCHHVSSAIALVPSTADEWDAAWLRTAGVYPRLIQNAFKMTLHYLVEYGERHVSLLTRSAEERLARTLTRLAKTSGRVLPAGVEVEMSNDDLAALSDVGMFTTSRQLKQWEREGRLVKRRQRVLIHDPDTFFPKS